MREKGIVNRKNNISTYALCKSASLANIALDKILILLYYTKVAIIHPYAKME
jgi:hypothetical protein